MPVLTGVRFGRSGPVHYCDAGDLELSVGDRVLVETEDGRKKAAVVIAPQQVLYSDLRGPLDPILRRLGEGD
jgi:cell fate regulator YaaT (PSP1 superfamily)